MKTIRILKPFPSTHHGYLTKGLEVRVEDSFADYCVKRMKAAEYVEKKGRKAKK
ncbi:MAG: hypothetical protein GY938_17810 [Ketobacter sp.]|nr:hypothetical protein [Ketobacter sp.]